MTSQGWRHFAWRTHKLSVVLVYVRSTYYSILFHLIMPSFCAVFNCSMRGDRDKASFYRFPAIIKHRGDRLTSISTQRRKKWVMCLKRGELSEKQLKYGRVCSKHFISGKPADLLDVHNPDWVPCQNLGYEVGLNLKKKAAQDRHSRYAKRLKPDEGISDISQVHDQRMVDDSAEVSTTESGTSVQTDLCMNEITNLFSALSFANAKLFELQSDYKQFALDEDSFYENDAKTTYFTGITSSKLLFVIHKTVSPYLTTHHNSALTTFQQLLLTLMKFRLNFPFKYLSYRFGVSPTTASATFYKCLDALYSLLKNLVFWPDRESLYKNIPTCFKQCFGNKITIIIDCFEIFIESHSDLLIAGQCWSNYKHHKTIKFLIGITPQGTVSYISDAWGGRTSDKFITENSGFLDKILPNDIIMADRGFLIKDSVSRLGGKLIIPAFTKGKNQLEAIDLENSRNIAHVRIHVERVIGLLRNKFKILQGPIPISMVSKLENDKSALDKIIVVCCALTNLCPSIIPMN